MLKQWLKIITGCSLLLLLVSCATVSKDPMIEVSYLGKDVDSFNIADECLEKLPRKVAILPFENETSRSDAQKLVRQGFYRHFSSKRYLDVELYEVDDLLAEHGLSSPDKYLNMPAKQVGDILDVDGLLYGKITGFNKMFFGLYSNVYVELEVTLVDTNTGETMWVVKHKSVHHEGQIPLELLGVVATIFRTSINVSEEELLRTVDDLCRTVVAALPEPQALQLVARETRSVSVASTLVR